MQRVGPIQCRYTLVYYNTHETQGWLQIFSRRVLGLTTFKTRLPLTSPAIELPFATDEVYSDDQLVVEVFARRSLCGDGSMQDSAVCAQFDTRVGFAILTINDLAQGNAKELHDIKGHKVGTLQLSLPANPKFRVQCKFPKHPLPDPSAGLTRLWHQTLNQQVTLQGSNIDPSLADIPHLTVVQPCCGVVPMWAFPLLNLTHEPPKGYYFRQARYNAAFLLGGANKTPAFLAEMLNEMQTLPTRQLYVTDTSKRANGHEEGVDDWINPLNAPEPRYFGFDCEDAAMRIVQDSWWWLHKPRGRLAEAERRYITFFVAMTLKTADAFAKQSSAQWVYHAAALKLDRNWVLYKLREKKEKEETKPWPPVLMEGTAYTTGCWQYTAENDKKTTPVVGFSKGDVNCKIPPADIHSKGLYGHILSLFSPELALTHGIVQIDLSDGNKKGARAKYVMDYEAVIEWHPIRLDKDAVKKAVTELQQRCFPPVRVPVVSKKPVKYSTPARPFTVDFILRDVDWNTDTRKELEKKLGVRLQAIKIQIADDLCVQRVVNA